MNYGIDPYETDWRPRNLAVSGLPEGDITSFARRVTSGFIPGGGGSRVTEPLTVIGGATEDYPVRPLTIESASGEITRFETPALRLVAAEHSSSESDGLDKPRSELDPWYFDEFKGDRDPRALAYDVPFNTNRHGIPSDPYFSNGVQYKDPTMAHEYGGTSGDYQGGWLGVGERLIDWAGRLIVDPIYGYQQNRGQRARMEYGFEPYYGYDRSMNGRGSPEVNVEGVGPCKPLSRMELILRQIENYVGKRYSARKVKALIKELGGPESATWCLGADPIDLCYVMSNAPKARGSSISARTLRRSASIARRLNRYQRTFKKACR